jgi:hypothetical protein
MFALSALDQAIHDLWGKLRGSPVYRLWGLSTDNIPMSDYTLGIDTPEKMVAKLHEMPGCPSTKSSSAPTTIWLFSVNCAATRTPRFELMPTAVGRLNKRSSSRPS